MLYMIYMHSIAANGRTSARFVGMTGEVWAVVGVGVALLVAILGQGYYLGGRIDALGRDLRSELGGRIDALAADLRALCERVAKLEVLFEFSLRPALAANRTSPTRGAKEEDPER